MKPRLRSGSVWGLAGLGAIASLLAGCASVAVVPTKPVMTALTGTITYRQKIALTPAARVKVFLQETSRSATPATYLDEVEIARPGQVPIPFTVHYDPAAVQPDHVYTLLVKIYEGDRTRFLNTSRYRVLTDGACVDRCEVVVDPID